MTHEEMLASRYPAPPALPLAWWGWRRPQRSCDRWERVPGAEAETRGTCYELVMQNSELANLHDGTGGVPQYEYLILPAGEMPPPLEPGRVRTR